MRRHPLDHGWLATLRDGLTDPFDPAHHVWHYQCADAKIEAPQSAPTGLVFYQTDPEASGVEYSGPTTPAGPITNVQFDQLRDDSQLVPGGTSVRLHAQVQNRSHTPADGVRVWVLYTPAAAGVPALDATTSGGSFPFWSQFQADGQVVLPCRRRAAGRPWARRSSSTASTRRTPGGLVALAGARADPRPGRPLLSRRLRSQRQRPAERDHERRPRRPHRPREAGGQKNVHLVGPKGGAGTGSSQNLTWPELYVEFHNPTRFPRESTLVVDLRTVPAEVEVSLRFTRLGTRRGVAGRGAPSRPTRYVGRPGDVVRVEGVTLRPRGFAAVRVSCRASPLPASIRQFRLEVQQQVRERVVRQHVRPLRSARPPAPRPRSADASGIRRARAHRAGGGVPVLAALDPPPPRGCLAADRPAITPAAPR